MLEVEIMDVGLVHLESQVKLEATPFVKWAGGKSQLLKQFEPLFPAPFNRYDELIEELHGKAK